MLIYKATSKTSKKSYIGKTMRTLETRKRGHRRRSRHCSYHFYNAIRKYGFEDFYWEIIENDINDENVLSEREIFWIKYYNTYNDGYNATAGGEGSSGRPMSASLKLKIQQANIGRIVSQQTRELLSLACQNRIHGKNNRLGTKHSIETKLKISTSNKNRVFTEEHKKKLSYAAKCKIGNRLGSHQSEETKKKISAALTDRTIPNKIRRVTNKTMLRLNHMHYMLLKYVDLIMTLKCDKGHQFDINRIDFSKKIRHNQVICTVCNQGTINEC
jgi:group I intron endonuclease